MWAFPAYTGPWGPAVLSQGRESCLQRGWSCPRLGPAGRALVSPKAHGMRQRTKMQSISRHTHLPSKLNYVQKPNSLFTQGETPLLPKASTAGHLDLRGTRSAADPLVSILKRTRISGPGVSGAQAGNSPKCQKTPANTGCPWKGSRTKPGGPGPPAVAHQA